MPSPNVTHNHQEHNARVLADAGGAVMLLERECSGEKLFDTAWPRFAAARTMG